MEKKTAFVAALFMSACVLLCGCQKVDTSVPQGVSPAPGAPQPAVMPQGAAQPIAMRNHAPEPQNLLKNPGFEAGLDKWQWLDWSKGWAPFKLSSDHAYEGGYSLHLPVASKDNRQTVVWGGVQEIELPGEIPDCIDGYYYVENWASGNWKQYLQMVVIDLSHSLGENRGQAQLRYIVSGSKEPPLTISNASYLFAEKVRRDTPVIGQWTHFSINPRKDFAASWQYVPPAGSKLRVLFEARFDLHKTTVPARADVYYDDLYIGPKTATRCAD